MKETPLLFKAAMVRAILDGNKTQTRRVVKLPVIDRNGTGCEIGGTEINSCLAQGMELCPFGQVGERIWVKETFAVQCAEGVSAVPWYRADYQGDSECDPPAAGVKWKPSIFMPRKASRITLEIVSVRVERLQEISEADAKAEGVTCPERGEVCSGFIPPISTAHEPEECACIDGYVPLYKTLWESINGAGSWEKNPFVWVIEFKKYERPTN